VEAVGEVERLRGHHDHDDDHDQVHAFSLVSATTGPYDPRSNTR